MFTHRVMRAGVHMLVFSILVLCATPVLVWGAPIIKNPIKQNNIFCLIYDVIQGVIGILSIVAALYIMYSGFLFVSARGNETKIKTAKSSFLNAIIGTAILLGAWAITTTIVGIINSVIANPIAVPTSSC